MAAPMSKLFLHTRILNGVKTCCHGEFCTPAFILQSRSKHWNPKFKKERKEKYMKIDLPDYDKVMGSKDKDQTFDEKRKEMKEQGMLPPITFNPRPIDISCTGGVFEQFVPPEGDGKSSLLSKEGSKTKLSEFTMKGKSLNEVRKMKKYEDNFDAKLFPSEALEIFVEAQKCLENIKTNEDRLHDLVTETAYPKMTFGLEYKTFRWNLIESIEPPRVVHVRTTDMMSKDNVYGQVTVRFHTKQTLAIYDRFGRLMYGSENLIKDVLEYVVFEKHVSNLYSMWRIHDKIVPDWMPPREPLLKTYIKPKMKPIPESKKKDTSESESPDEQSGDQDQPALATA